MDIAALPPEIQVRIFGFVNTPPRVLLRLRLLGRKWAQMVKHLKVEWVSEDSITARQLNALCNVFHGMTRLAIESKSGLELPEPSDFKAMENLKALKVLDLGLVQLSDEHLAVICARTTTIEHMRLKSWALTDAGMLHLTRLVHLKWLELDRCFGVTAASLSALAVLPDLGALNFKNRGPFNLAPYGALKALRGLSIAAERWPEIEPSLEQTEPLVALHASLQKLVVSSCKIPQPALASIGQLTQLRDARFYQCFPIVNLTYLSRLTLLERLELDESRVFDVEVLSNFPSLTALYTPKVDLPAGDLIHLLQLRPLRVLDISDNWNVREERAAWVLGHLTSLMHLEEFYCKNVSNADMLPHLTALPALRLLDIRGSTLGSQGLQYIGKITQLRELKLGKVTGVTDQSLRFLVKLTNLRNLSLAGCTELSLDGLMCLQHLTQLRRIAVEGCKKVEGDTRALQRMFPFVGLFY